MRKDNSVILNVPPKTIADARQTILTMARDKSVLNVGAAGNASAYVRAGHDQWLHAQLHKSARTLVGLDLDPDEVSAAKQMGFDIRLGNCEQIQLGQRFDVIVMADVVEHIGNVAQALGNMQNHLVEGGKIVITTPNATYLGNIVNAVLRRAPHVYWDHVHVYLPENIQALCDREGWKLEGTYYFTQTDHRHYSVLVKSRMVNALGALLPRLHSSFLCVIAHQGSVI